MMWNFLSEDISVGLEQHYEAILRRLKNATQREASAPSTNQLGEVPSATGGGGGAGGVEITTWLSKAKIKTSDYLNLCFRIKWFFNTYVKPVKKAEQNYVSDYPR